MIKASTAKLPGLSGRVSLVFKEIRDYKGYTETPQLLYNKTDESFMEKNKEHIHCGIPVYQKRRISLQTG